MNLTICVCVYVYTLGSALTFVYACIWKTEVSLDYCSLGTVHQDGVSLEHCFLGTIHHFLI